MTDRLLNFLKCLLIGSTFLIFFPTFSYATESFKGQLKFMLITQREANDPFWGVVEEIASAAAKDLDIKLYIRHAQSDKGNMLSFIYEAADREVDAIIFPNFKSITPSFLRLAEKHKIYTFLFNAGINNKNAARVGRPRGKYKYWLGYSLPDDELAGYLLAKTLIEKAKKNNLKDAAEHIQVVGITGIYANFPSMIRVQGLERAVNEYPNVDLKQVVYSEWKQKVAKKQMLVLNHRYPNASVYWGASDLISIGIAEGSKELKLSPDKIITGGIDWSLPGLTAIEEKKITISVGGHIFEAAWATIMLYDYFNGIDFKKHLHHQQLKNYSSAIDVVLPMSAIKKEDLGRLKKRIRDNNWDDLNFKKFSIHHNPTRNYYDFSSPDF